MNLNKEKQNVLDKGFVRFLKSMGGEMDIVDAARVSGGTMGEDTDYNIGDIAKDERDINLIRYLMRHWHTTPFEMCEIKLHIKAPIFIARQWFRHRTASFNEISGRYTNFGEVMFYLPDLDQLTTQSAGNHQGRSGVPVKDAVRIQGLIKDSNESGLRTYKTFTEVQLAKEIARGVLNQNMYTEFYYKTDLHNLFHFLSLRCDSHAQYEIRQYASVIANMVEKWVPNVYEAFMDYRVNSETFSAEEVRALRSLIDKDSSLVGLLDGSSKRERENFSKVLGLKI